MSKPKAEREESRRKVWKIDVRQVVENHNPRNPLPECLRERHGCMTGLPNDLWLLAISGDAEKKAEFIRLMGQDEAFVAWASTFIAQGQLEPIELRDNGAKGDAANTYTVVFGARRCLAAAYNACATGKKSNYLVDAYLAPKLNQVGLLHRSIVENQRSDPNPIEQANALLMCLNQQQSIEEIALAQGKSTTWVKNMLALLELPPTVQKKIASGKMPIKKALTQQQESSGHVAKERQGIKKRVQAALAPFAEEAIEACAESLQADDVDPNIRVTITLSIGEIRAILALIGKEKHERSADLAEDHLHEGHALGQDSSPA